MKHVTPSDDRLVVEPHEAETTTAGGLIIPEVGQEKPAMGTVVSVGPGRMEVAASGPIRIPIDFKAGDVVLYGKYSGSQVQVEGRDILLLRASDILAVVTDDED